MVEFDFFKKKEKNNEDEFMNKIYSRRSFINKLDFNCEYLNKYLIECIMAYLSSIYKQNSSLCKKYLSQIFFENTHKEIEDNKKRFKYSKSYINIVNAELQNQTIETINYVSHIVISVEVAAIYNQQNIFTGTIKKIEENYEESIEFIFENNGWKINNILKQNYKSINDTIIKF